MDAIIAPPVRHRETLGAKLRRLARSAEIANPLILNPLKAPPPWAQGATVTLGEVRSAGGNWYACAIPGVTAASGAGPSHTSGQVLGGDGTAGWSYLGPAPIAADDPDAPVLTSSTSAPGSPNDWSPTPIQHPQLFRLFGCYGEAVVTNYIFPWAFESKAATRDYSYGAAGIETDAQIVAFRLYTNQPSPRVLVGGRYLQPGGFPRAAASTWHTMTFPTRRTRQFLFEGGKEQWVFSTVSIPRSAAIRPMPPAEARAVFVGDSLFVGSSYGPWPPGNNVPNRVSKRCGWGDVWNLSKGGTGWIATGGGFYTYGQRVAQALALNPDILVFGTPTNDYASSAASITAAVKAALESVRAAGYAGPIVVLGAWPKNDANVATAETAVAAGVTQAADPLGLTFFIPLFATSYAPVVCGPWNNAFNAILDNSALAISADGTHPGELGTAILADFVAQEIRRSVLPAIR